MEKMTSMGRSNETGQEIGLGENAERGGGAGLHRCRYRPMGAAKVVCSERMSVFLLNIC